MLALATFSWLLTWPGKVEATEARPDKKLYSSWMMIPHGFGFKLG